MKNLVMLFLCLIGMGSTMIAQNRIQSVIANHFNENLEKSALNAEDVEEYKITSVVPSLNPDIQHVYLQQYYKGIPIRSAVYKLTVTKNDEVTYEVNQFVQNLNKKVTASKSSPTITPQSAIRRVAASHNIERLKLSNAIKNASGGLTFSGSEGSQLPITAEKMYILENDQLVLSWKVELYENDGSHYWKDHVDASTGKIISSEDLVIDCNFSNDHATHFTQAQNHSYKKSAGQLSKRVSKSYYGTSLAPDSYLVFAEPLEAPSFGERSLIVDPADPIASPFGWHDTDGDAGAEFTITRGNNVWAADDRNGNNQPGVSADGGESLDFEFPIDLTQRPLVSLDASLTNLFYWNNLIHDVFYQYGFDEASGNFQQNNYGNGGIGDDFVIADCQDGAGRNNANILVLPDGTSPRMQMFLWNQTNPNRDGSFDNGVIVHEYGHGISIRLVGGPGIDGIGRNSEQMGEGWSDYFALIMTMKEGDNGRMGRGIGTYVLGQETTDVGIRPTPYTVDRAINDTDYSDISSLAVPHGVGYAFATILWDMTWEIIDEEGFDPDLYQGNGGNNIALRLVVEGLKNTALSPGFVDARNAILQADRDLYDGKYNCMIWKAFSGRGVGRDADQGSSRRGDEIVDFNNPCIDGPAPDFDDCVGNITEFTYSESFEGNFEDWRTDSNSEIEWELGSGNTDTPGTGPSGASDGENYLYIDASDNFPEKSAYLNFPCLDVSSLFEPSIKFDYHMLGTNIGSLYVEARTNNEGRWRPLWNADGARGNNWRTQTLSLQSFTGNSSVQLRFKAITGLGELGDIAIDNISIFDTGTTQQGCDVLLWEGIRYGGYEGDGGGALGIGVDDSWRPGISVYHNTWVSRPFNYSITENTILEFEFYSSGEDEIHAIGFDDDLFQSPERFFKLRGTVDYGITDFDDYERGDNTKKYSIPVGEYYTGNMSKMILVCANSQNPNGRGSSVFRLVKVYEKDECNQANASLVEGFAEKSSIADGYSARIAPNPAKNNFVIDVNTTEGAPVNVEIFSLLGKKIETVTLQNGSNEFSSEDLKMTTGIYLVKFRKEGQPDSIEKLVIE